jgi:oligopeptide transport system substrate-binding protein
VRRPSILIVVVGLSLVALSPSTPGTTRAADRPARILVAEPSTLDPAAQGDASSAAITAQLFETLTTFDSTLTLRPALAQAWVVQADGKQIVFTLRPDLAFSDGTPLRASDVVRSWLRLIDPAHPSPLASLVLAIDGAAAYLHGTSTDPATVGLHADDGARTVTVDLARPSSEFVEAVASPSFGIVPPGADQSGAFDPGGAFVGSGGYVPSAVSATGMTLTANGHYWAGRPAIAEIDLVTDIAGQSPVEVFQAGDLDYTEIFSIDAPWVAYDPTLGPSLRRIPSMAVDYYGFDTSKPPFDDVRVRQAFGMAVDWRRVALLGSPDGATDVATSMVPPGVEGRSSTDVVPKHDPAAARDLLAQAGYPGGRGFPAVTMITGGGPYDAAVVAQVKQELGIDLSYETEGFDTYFTRLADDAPAIWSLSWIADYPGRNDFLGVLLGSDSTNDYGHWTSPAFDQAITDAGTAANPTAASAAYDRAEAIVERDVPVVPVAYGTGWALSRPGLLGAGQNGLGILRMAGLTWSP